MSKTLTTKERRARARERRAAGCTGALTCPCLCHDTQGGSHHHHGRVCDGQPGEYQYPEDVTP